jgi:hypothetical protein
MLIVKKKKSRTKSQSKTQNRAEKFTKSVCIFLFKKQERNKDKQIMNSSELS